MLEIEFGSRGGRQLARTCFTWSGFVLASVCLACGASDKAAPIADIDEGAQPGGGLVIERLQELDMGGQRLTFDWVLSDVADDGTPLDVEGAAAGYFSISYASDGPNLFDALMAEHGLLTSLEVFTAFAPRGLEPDPMLIEAHEGEARALGRADLAPKVLDVAQLAIEKSIPANCDSATYPNVAPLTWASQQSETIAIDGLSFYLCAGTPKKSGQGNPSGCVRQDNRKAVVVSVCNDSVSSDSTPWTFFLNGIQAFTNPTPVFHGSVGVQFFNAQPLPPGPGILPTRSLAVRSSNLNTTVNTHYQRSGVSSSL